MNRQAARRPRLALPFTVLTDRNIVRLVAGEDHRFTFTAAGLDEWLPALLSAMDGRTPTEELLARVPAAHREDGAELIERLVGERIALDGTAADAHVARCCRAIVEGTGPLVDALAGRDGNEKAANERAGGNRSGGERDGGDCKGGQPDGSERPAGTLRILCQDRLDIDAVLAFNRRCLAGTAPWMWVTTGPMARGYVSPVILPDAGPCLACLIGHFIRLSPAPEIYEHLCAHGREGGTFVPSPFPAEGLDTLLAIARWKVAHLSDPLAPAGLYRLHVLDLASMEVKAHGVWIDPECPDCSPWR